MLVGFIKTKAKPEIYYLPAEHTPKTEQLLTETKTKMEGIYHSQCTIKAIAIKASSFMRTEYCLFLSLHYIEKIKKRQEEIEELLANQQEPENVDEETVMEREGALGGEGVTEDVEMVGEGGGMGHGRSAASDSGEASD